MFQKCAVLIVMAIVTIAASGCAAGMGGPFSSGHYGGEGVLTGGAVGGITAAAITKGNPLGIAIGAVSGAIVGGVIGGQVPKEAGIAERDMALDAKRMALLEQCRRDEWNRVEQSIRYSQVYGGKPEQYYVPDYMRCDRAYRAPVVKTQSRSVSPAYVPQFNIQRY